MQQLYIEKQLHYQEMPDKVMNDILIIITLSVLIIPDVFVLKSQTQNTKSN